MAVPSDCQSLVNFYTNFTHTHQKLLELCQAARGPRCQNCNCFDKLRGAIVNHCSPLDRVPFGSSCSFLQQNKRRERQKNMLYYISPFYTCTPPCKYVNITSTLFQFSSIYNIAQQFLIFVTLIRQRIQYASNYLLFSKKNYHAYISSYLNHLFHHILSIVSISCVFIHFLPIILPQIKRPN